MFKNNKAPTLYKQGYGRAIQVRNYGSSYTLPDCKLSCEQIKNTYCTDKAWVTSKLRNHKVNVNTEVQSQQLIQENGFSCGPKPMLDNKWCPINNTWASTKRKVQKTSNLNIHAPEFYPGNIEQHIKVGCNVVAKVFSPKNTVNVCYVAELVNKLAINNNDVNIQKSYDKKFVKINQVETLDGDFTNLKTSANVTVNQNTSVLNKCDIYDRMVSTTVNTNKTILKNISSTSRPRDTANSNQQNTSNFYTLSDSCFTWLSSISTTNCHNEVQKKYVDKINFTANTSI